MKNQYGDKVTIVYKDTDSFINYIKTEYFYEDMKQIIDNFVTPRFLHLYQYNIPSQFKKVLGKIKDELNGVLTIKNNPFD